MRKKVHDNGFTIWLSANDTYDWAHRSGNSWPCSTLSGHRLVASFDANGLLDIAVDGKCDAPDDIDGHEFSCCVADHAAEFLPEDHPAWFVAVGQFR